MLGSALKKQVKREVTIGVLSAGFVIAIILHMFVKIQNEALAKLAYEIPM